MKKMLVSTKMKIFMLILLLLSITFYASGCIALAQSGYKISDYADELHLSPTNFNFNWDFDKLNFDFNTSSISNNYPINDNISEIDFNLSSQDIKVTNYDGDDLNIEIKSRGRISGELPKSENGNKLVFSTKYDIPSNSTILVSVPNKFKDKGIFKIITSSGDIDVSNLSVNTLNASAANGDIDAANLNLYYLSLNSSSGDMKLNNISASTETKLISSSGDISGNGNFGTLTSNTSSGDIKLKFINSINNISIGTHSGSASLSIPKTLGYKVNFQTVSGHLNSSSKELSYGDESSLINVNTTSGNLTIN